MCTLSLSFFLFSSKRNFNFCNVRSRATKFLVNITENTLHVLWLWLQFQTHIIQSRWLLVIGICVCCGFYFRPNEIATVCWHCVFDFNSVSCVFACLFLCVFLFLVGCCLLSYCQIHTWHRHPTLITEAICSKHLNWRCKIKCRQSFWLSFIVIFFFFFFDFACMPACALGRVYLHVLCISQSKCSIPLHSRWNHNSLKTTYKAFPLAACFL